ncbi:hypothetical protein DFAR_3440008 [Desulfarculales bacterium]
MSAAPKRSTLSYANQQRPSSLFRALFFKAMERFRAQGPLGRKKGKFKFKNKLLSLTSSTIILCLSLFPWPSTSGLRAGSRLTSCWTTATTCPALSCLPRPRWPISPWPRGWR